MMIMDTYRAAKDLPKALAAGKEALAKYPADPAIRASHALLLGESGQTEDAVKILRAQLRGNEGDREVYLNIAQVYERGRHYKEAEEAARAAEIFRQSRGTVQESAGGESKERTSAELLRLYAGRSGNPAG